MIRSKQSRGILSSTANLANALLDSTTQARGWTTSRSTKQLELRMKFPHNPGNPASNLLLAILGSVAATLTTQADQLIYSDSLQNSWRNWSWATVDFNHAPTIHSGAKSIDVIA